MSHETRLGFLLGERQLQYIDTASAEFAWVEQRAMTLERYA